MDKRKLKIALSLAVLIPCVLYAAGIIAQFIININAWKSAGSDYRTSPGLPSSQISEVVRALFHFPEGLIAIGVVVLGIAVHEPDWKSSQASSVSASGVSSPSVTAAIPAEKANVGSQKKPPGKPPRSTTRKVVNADELF